MKGFSEMSNSELANVSDIAGVGNKAVEQIGTLREGSAILSTMNGDTREGKIGTLNAVTNAEPLSDHLGETINLVHCVFQAISLTDETTGVVSDAVRTILIDADGASYAAVSAGLFGSLRDIFGILGQPATWDQPLSIVVSEQKGRKGYKFFKVSMA
jgi:hypothetical protein